MTATNEVLTPGEYVDLFAGGVSQGDLVTFSSGSHGRRQEAFNVESKAALIDFINEQSNAGANAYLRANVQLPGGTTVATVGWLTVVTLDFDLAGPGHVKDSLPTKADDLPLLLQFAEVPEPTFVLSTGGGLFAAWVLAEPVQIQSDEDRATAKALSNGFQAHILKVALEQFGWRLDNTSDLVRACRVPETRNWKEAYGPAGRPVTVHAHSGRRLQLEELRAIAARVVPSPKPKRARATPHAAETDDHTPASWEAIYEGCAALREWADTRDGLPEPHWYALAGVVGRCINGREIFHQLSADDARYTRAEADEKLTHAITSAAPRLCTSIQELGGNCRDCPFRGRINSPMSLGYTDPKVTALASRWVFVAQEDAFIDLATLGAGR